MAHFGAKLLFQFRVVGDSGPKRQCELRIINFESEQGSSALAYAKRYGRGQTYKYRNSKGQRVVFEFIGVMDLLEFGIELHPGEVCYERSIKRVTKESRRKLVPTDKVLLGTSVKHKRLEKS